MADCLLSVYQVYLLQPTVQLLGWFLVQVHLLPMAVLLPRQQPTRTTLRKNYMLHCCIKTMATGGHIPIIVKKPLISYHIISYFYPGGGEDSDMKGAGMLVGNFENDP
jgi:hypothetical protein